MAQYQDRDTPRCAQNIRDGSAAEQRVDINHATIEELLKVPGMTRSWAGRIVRFRPYRTKQDLLDKGVVTAQVYDRIKDLRDRSPRQAVTSRRILRLAPALSAPYLRASAACSGSRRAPE